MRNTFHQVISDAYMRLKRDVKDSKWAIIIIIAYFVCQKLFFHSMCPMVWMTGYPCPACGLTRAGICLLHLDFAGAWKMHPFIYAVLGYFFLFLWNRYILQRNMGKYMKYLLILIFVGMVLFYIWRMLRYFPGEPPMSYYYHNLCRLLRSVIAGMK